MTNKYALILKKINTYLIENDDGPRSEYPVVSISRFQRVQEAIWLVRDGEAGLTSAPERQKTLSSVTMTTMKGRRHRKVLRVYFTLTCWNQSLWVCFFAVVVSLFCILSVQEIQMLLVSLT